MKVIQSVVCVSNIIKHYTFIKFTEDRTEFKLISGIVLSQILTDL